MHRTSALVYAGAALYAVVLVALGADRYLTHRSVEDLGIFAQAIAGAAHGMPDTIEGGSHLAVHFSPILFLIAPLMLAAHSALALVAVQAIACALVAPAIYHIARRRTSDVRAAWIALVALLYPPLAGVAFTEFHENGLVPALAAWLVYAADARRFGLALVLAAALLCTKEDQALFVAWDALAALVWFRRRGDAAGVRSALIALAAAVAVVPLYFGVVRPLVAHGPWHPLVFLHAVGGAGHVGALRELTDRLGYVALALAPLAFVPLGSFAIVLALPGFAEVLLSRAPVTYTMGQHYAAVWIPYVLAAFAFAAPGLTLARVCAALCVVVYLVANPLHPRYFLGPYLPRDAQLDRFLATLPPDLAVGTQEEIFTHLGFDPNATLGIECRPPFALFDLAYPESAWVQRDVPLLRDLVARGRYRLERRDGPIELYARVGGPLRDDERTALEDPWEFPCRAR